MTQPNVYIVGAGPGDPELISLRGHRLLSQADLVVYAGSLVPEQMLEVCRPDAELVDTRSHVLETWIPTIVKRAKAGKLVVRLQDGDPCLYGALNELTRVLVENDLAFEVVPGVSAFQLAAARLQAELTVPEVVQSIILTRIQGRTNVPDAEDLASLAAHRASLCLYLSARHSEAAQAKLLAHYPPETPVALCYRLGWPDEEIHLARLENMHALTRELKHIRTVMYLISPALADNPEARSRLYSPEHAHLFRVATAVSTR